VKLLHNEQEIEFPGCGEMYCPYEKFKSLYQEYLNLNLNQLCGVSSCNIGQECQLPPKVETTSYSLKNVLGDGLEHQQLLEESRVYGNLNEMQRLKDKWEERAERLKKEIKQIKKQEKKIQKIQEKE